MKTIINPIIPMKNTGGNSQDCKTDLERIRTASSRQQLNKLNFKVDAVRSICHRRAKHVWGKIFSLFFPSLLFLIKTYGCMCETERDHPFRRALKKLALFQNDGISEDWGLQGLSAKTIAAAMHLATSAASPSLPSSSTTAVRERKDQWRKSCFLGWASLWE